MITIVLLLQSLFSVSISPNFRNFEFNVGSLIEIPYTLNNTTKKEIVVQAVYFSVFDYSNALYIDEYQEYLDFLKNQKTLSHEDKPILKMAEYNNTDKLTNNCLDCFYIKIKSGMISYQTHKLFPLTSKQQFKPGKYKLKIYIIESESKQVVSDSAIFFVRNNNAKYERNYNNNSEYISEERSKNISKRINEAPLDSLIEGIASIKSNYRRELVLRQLGSSFGIRVYRKKSINASAIVTYFEKMKSYPRIQGMLPIVTEGIKSYIIQIGEVVPSVNNDSLRNQIFEILKKYEAP